MTEQSVKRKTGSKLCGLLMIAILVSFLGFWVENLFITMTLGFMDNRNMHLPFLVGYGLGMLAVYGMLGTPQTLRFFHVPIPVANPFWRTLIYYMVTCLLVMVGEIVLGTIVERVCDVIWWEYTTLPLHITKYSSIPTTLAFAALITLFMGKAFMPIYTRFSRGYSWGLLVFSGIGILALMLDFAWTVWEMYKTADFIYVWKIDFSDSFLHELWLKYMGAI